MSSRGILYISFPQNFLVPLVMLTLDMCMAAELDFDITIYINKIIIYHVYLKAAISVEKSSIQTSIVYYVFIVLDLKWKDKIILV